MAFAADRPSRRSLTSRRIHHSDQGAQYVSLVFGRRYEEAGIPVSMGAKGSALDNAVCESFFSSLEKDLLHRRSWPTLVRASSCPCGASTRWRAHLTGTSAT